MKDFKHHNIMPLIGVCIDTTLGVVMPFMENGSVLSYLKKHKETLLLNDDADIEEVSIIVQRRHEVRLCLVSTIH